MVLGRVKARTLAKRIRALERTVGELDIRTKPPHVHRKTWFHEQVDADPANPQSRSYDRYGWTCRGEGGCGMSSSGSPFDLPGFPDALR